MWVLFFLQYFGATNLKSQGTYWHKEPVSQHNLMRPEKGGSLVWTSSNNLSNRLGCAEYGFNIKVHPFNLIQVFVSIDSYPTLDCYIIYLENISTSREEKSRASKQSASVSTELESASLIRLNFPKVIDWPIGAKCSSSAIQWRISYWLTEDCRGVICFHWSIPPQINGGCVAIFKKCFYEIFQSKIIYPNWPSVITSIIILNFKLSNFGILYFLFVGLLQLVHAR